jgi:hypothetical protein
MFARIGLLALAVMVGSEAFVASATILWPLAAIAHLGAMFENGALAVALILGVAAGVWLWQRALHPGGGEAGF